MKINSINIIMLLIATMLISIQSRAQKVYTLDSDAEIVVSGTSTLHDWDVKSGEAKGKAIIEIKDQQLQSISSLVVSIPAKSLKSGKSAMDNNTYKALQANEHPEITFNLIKVNSINQLGNQAEIDALGELIVAGETRTINVQVSCEILNNILVIQGDKSLKMTDFNIQPPVALLGTVKTGDDINVSFKVNFKNKLS